MNKIKVKQRDEDREVYEWAMDAGKEIEDRSICSSLLLPDTDVAIMSATLLTTIFDEHAPKAGQKPLDQ